MNRLSILSEEPESKESVSPRSGRFPSWLRRKLPPGGELFRTNEILRKYRLSTVCEEAKCPNRLECYTKQTATFLALGKACTRKCGFCDIDFTKSPLPPEGDEPERIALSVRDLGLQHAVITMVARDDLPDFGAAHMAAIIRTIREINPATTIEALTSDFSGDTTSLQILLAAEPDVFNHNLETVRSLSPRVRHRAQYERSLEVLKQAKQSSRSRYVKSGLMVGLGETQEELYEALADLAQAGCDIVTIGQYLQASNNRLRVKAFISPEQFKALEEKGSRLGIQHMYCGPFVRSSYNAHLFAPSPSAL